METHTQKVTISSWDDIFLTGWITGFTDGEGSFSVSFSKRAKMSTGLEVRPSFSLSQKDGSHESFKLLEQVFSGGGIRYSKKDDTWKYEIRNLSSLLNQVIPFFEKHRLQTRKINDFYLFSEVCFLMKKNQHLNEKGLSEIIEKAYSMNPSGKRRYTKDSLLSFLKYTSGSS